jgi:histidinol phosphatase-like enzyme
MIAPVIPIPNQSGICIGSSSAPQRTTLHAFVASILAALMSSLI